MIRLMVTWLLTYTTTCICKACVSVDKQSTACRPYLAMRTFLYEVYSDSNFVYMGAKVPQHFCFLERKFQGAKVPGSESFTNGIFTPGNESMWERKFQLPSIPKSGMLPP